MPKLTDLTGREIAGHWRVISQAPSVKRVRHWNVQHAICGAERVQPHELVMRADAGKAELSCSTCTPAQDGPNPHRHPGTIHEQGELRVGEREAAEQAAHMLAGDRLNLVAGLVKGSATATPVVGQYEQGWEIQPTPDAGELLQVPVNGQLIDAGSGHLRIHGKAEALAEAQDHLDVIRRGISREAKPGNGTAGMSALGGCERKLAWRLAYGKPAGTAWRPWVGTQAHGTASTGLEGIYQADNALQAWKAQAAGWKGVVLPARWMTSTYVTVSNARGIIDLYDRERFEVVDWKVPGITAVRRVVSGKVSDQYEVQLDLYGLGMVERGYRVDTVALLVLPAAGELEDAAWMSRPVDLDRARAAIVRRDKINALLAVAPPDVVLGALEIQEDSCDYCPAKRAGQCPGFDPKPEAAPSVAWDVAPIEPPPGVLAMTVSRNSTLEEK